MFTTFLDVTEIKISEEHIRRCERILEHSTNAIRMSSPEGELWYQNKAFSNLFGTVNDKQLTARYVDKKIGHEIFKELMSGREWSGEVEMYGQNKKVLNILLRAYAIKDNSGTITYLVGEHIDITARKEMEKKLIESEKRYRTIIERGKDAIYLCNMKGKILQTNEIACQNLGYARDELLTMYVKDIDVDFALDKSFNDFVNSLTPDSQTIIESIHKRKNGSTFPVEINIGKFESPGENYIIGFARDISDRKKSEEQLKLTQFGIDHSQIAVFQIDEDACIKYANEQACNSLGYTQEELLKMKIYQLDPNFDTQKWKKHRAETRELGSRTIETQHRRKDGTFIPVEVTINYIIFENKNISFSFAKDITERKKAEEIIRASESRLFNAIKIAKLAYWEFDMVNNIYTFNDQFYSMYKTSVDQIGSYHMNFEEYLNKFVHPDDIKIIITPDREQFRTNDPHFSYQLEHRVIFGNGELGYIVTRYYEEKDENGKITKIFGANQDITEQKSIETALVAAKEKAEENDRFKTAFLNNMSHEIRTPLNVILGYAGLINEGIQDPKELKSLTEPIFRSSEQLQKIIEDILDISRIETGQMSISSQNVNINDLLKQVVDEQKLRAQKKNLSLIVSGKLRESAAVVLTDSSKLKQILINLVTNAIKYSIEGSVQVSVKKKNQDILFIIQDTGIGIEEKYHEVIFERFHRLDSIETQSYHSSTEGGTGLGLPISKGLVELLGGQIWLESIPEKGTTFYFTIPRK